MKTWLITGVSRGLGLALAKAALAHGDNVVGTIRKHVPDIVHASGQLTLIEVDLLDRAGLEVTVHKAFQAYGRIDVLVNNAGFGLLGVFENATDAELQHLFDVDVFAPMRLTRHALPYFRRQGSGHIVNITSIAGRAPGAGYALYAAAKAAMEGFSAALAQEVRTLGINVTAVAPGQFRTDFLSASSIQRSAGVEAGYSTEIDAALGNLSRLDQRQLGDPELAARAIVHMVHCAEPPLQLLLGSDALQRAQLKLNAVKEEMERWKDISVSTEISA